MMVDFGPHNSQKKDDRIDLQIGIVRTIATKTLVHKYTAHSKSISSTFPIGPSFSFGHQGHLVALWCKT